MRYLDPKNDLTFKKIFGQHPNLLKSFLNALLPLEENQEIESLKYLSPELVPEIPLLKNTIVDVICIDNKGRQFIVEMQMLWTDSFKSRVLFNASKAYVKQLERGKEYKSLQPVYALSLVNDIFEPEMHDFYHHYKIVNIENTEKQLKGLEFVFVELPKFKAQNIEHKRLQVLWLKFLTEVNDGSPIIPAELLENKEINEALNCLQESAYTKEELEAYDRYWDTIQSERSLIFDAEVKGMTEGKIEGLIEGEVKGMIKGKIEGKLEGEHENSLKIAKLMKSSGEPIEKIILFTGLSKKEIENL